MDNADATVVPDDPYLKLLRTHLEDPDLFRATPEETRLRQQDLLLPYLDFFLRHDPNRYYRRLFERKHITDAQGDLRPDLELEDLARLRVHSDDLRGDGQKARLVISEAEGVHTFRSSGTTANPQGAVSITRSELGFEVCSHAVAGQLNWMVGPGFRWSKALIQAAPEMAGWMALPAHCAAALRHCGAEVMWGARLRDDPAEPNVWKRIEPDPGETARFFEADGPGKFWIATPAGLGERIAAQQPIDMGDDGVLFTGGGLKRMPQFTSMAQLFEALEPLVRGRLTDALGMTESTTVFGTPAGAPADRRWVKCPHPLAYVGYFESPQRFELSDAFDEPRLLLYVNFTCIDYLEAVVTGDVVRPQRTPDWPQNGFVYERRADEGEGFAIREGCG